MNPRLAACSSGWRAQARDNDRLNRLLRKFGLYCAMNWIGCPWGEVPPFVRTWQGWVSWPCRLLRSAGPHFLRAFRPGVGSESTGKPNENIEGHGNAIRDIQHDVKKCRAD